MFASHPRAKHWSPKNSRQANQIAMNSHNKFLFECCICHHECEKSPYEMVSLKGWCLYCELRKLCNGDCDFCYANSFASHEYAQHWIYEQNDKTPREIFKRCSTKYWFHCPVCEHDFKKAPKRITGKNNGCCYCNSHTLCEEDNCEFCYNKSLASDPRVEQFRGNEHGKTARQIVKKGKEICTFECETCKHFFSSKIGDVIMNDRWCGYCDSKRWCEDKACEKCIALSFASHERARYIVDKSIDLTRVRKGSIDKYEFKCEKCPYIFSKRLSDVIRGSWCPKCVNKTEKKLFDILNEMYEDTIFQKQFVWCKGPKNKVYPFDFFIPSKQLIIELDGEQHFKDVPVWKKSCVEQKKRDVFKMTLANKYKYSIIRLLQPDVLADKNNWKNLLIEAIDEIDCADDIMNIYIGKNNIYGDHIRGVRTANKLITNVTKQ